MKSIELFAGAGGLALGVERAGFRHRAVIEIDPHACETLAINTNWPLRGGEHGDVRSMDFSPWAGKVDLVTGGPPCQPFSTGGKHGAHLDSRDRFPDAIRAVRELTPRAFMFENVKGLKRKTYNEYLEYIRLCLCYPELLASDNDDWSTHWKKLKAHDKNGQDHGLRYDVTIALVNAADYGVPQRRERVFLVGIRSDINAKFRPPSPTHSQDALLWSKWRDGEYWKRHGVLPVEDGKEKARAAKLVEKPETLPWRTVRDALRDLPDPERHPPARRKIDGHVHVPGAREYPGHTGSFPDWPAKTLKAGVHGVPGGENMLRKPDGSVRYFTLRECARLQTFPDDWRFHGARSTIIRQLGNAVPVMLAEKMAAEIRKILEGDKQRK